MRVNTNHIPEKFFFMLFILMNVIGMLFYYLNINYYTSPSKNALLYISIFNAMIVIGWMIFAVIFYRKPFIIQINKKKILEDHKRNTDLTELLGYISIFLILIYIITFKDHFIITSIINNSDINESMRPDIVGNVPGYWTFSVILNSLTIPFVIQFAINSLQKKYILTFITWILLLIFFGIILGSKSGLIVIFFYVLFFIYKPTFKSIILFAIVFLFTYTIIKYSYSTSHSYIDFIRSSNILESMIRRVSIINVSIMGVIFDNLIFMDEKIPESYTHIKQYSFHQIYGYLPGGAPVPFHVELAYSTGLGLYIIPLLPILIFTLLAYKYFFFKYCSAHFYHVSQFLTMYGSIILVSGTLFDFFARFVIPSMLLLFTSSLSSSLKTQ